MNGIHLPPLMLDRATIAVAAANPDIGQCPAFIRFRSHLAEKLVSLTGDTSTLLRIAQASYRHPNGFDKIVLGSVGNKYKLRLHVWHWLDPSLGHSADVHDHFWNFSSLVLCGNVLSEVYRPSDQRGTAMEKFALLPRVSGAFALEFRGVEYLEQIRSDALTAGDVHSLSSAQLHRMHLIQPEYAATLVLQGDRERSNNFVYRTVDSTKSRETHVPRYFTPAEIRAKIEELICAIR